MSGKEAPERCCWSRVRWSISATTAYFSVAMTNITTFGIVGWFGIAQLEVLFLFHVVLSFRLCRSWRWSRDSSLTARTAE